MRIAALLRRARERSPKFLAYKAAQAVRRAARTGAARFGANPYRVSSSLIERQFRCAQPLEQLDRSLILLPSDAPRIAKETLSRGISEKIPESRRELIERNNVRVLGSPPIDLDAIRWNVDYSSGLQWDPGMWHDEIDYMDLERASDVKIPWELNRLQFVAELARSYALTQQPELANRCVELIRRWDQQNPAGYSVAWACAMDVSFRAISLLWIRSFLRSAAHVEPAFWTRIVRMLVEHGRFIYRNPEYSDVRGNHYSADLVGLLQIACAVPWYKQTKRWKHYAVDALRTEILHETYCDGVDHEGSIPYHRLVLEIFLHAGLCAKRNDIELGDAYWQRLEKMCEFVQAYLKPDGAAPLIGDNDDGRVAILGDQSALDHRYLLALGAVLFERGDFKQAAGRYWEQAAWLLGIDGFHAFDAVDATCAPQRSSALPDGGYWFLRRNDDYVAIDCADIGLRSRGGHGHHDILHACISLEGEDLIVDRGCFRYTSDKQHRRDVISIASHNAVVLDGEEPASFSSWDIPLAGFYRAEPIDWDTDTNEPYFCGKHDGYLATRGVTVYRTARLSSGKAFIEDRIEGSGTHELMWRWRLAPGLIAMPHPSENRCIIRRKESDRIFEMTWDGAEFSVQVEDAEYHRNYGTTETVCALVLQTRTALPAPVRFVFSVSSETDRAPSAC